MRYRRPRRASANSKKYGAAFVRHVHELVWLGCERLDREKLNVAAEPAISGALCEAIEEVLDDPASEDWVDDYEVHDDPPIHDKERKGKHRRRIDIKLASRRTRPRLRFSFEAKLLGRNNRAGKYFGEDGLGRFLEGSYAANQDIGGMLGYVTSEDCDAWAKKLAKSLDRKKHKVTSDGAWVPMQENKNRSATYRTRHRRLKKLPPIEIHHLLISFVD